MKCPTDNRFSLLRFFALTALPCLLAPAGVRAADTAGKVPASAPASQPLRLLDEAIAGRVGAIASLEDDADADRAIRDRRREIRERLQTTNAAEEQVALALGWANWELAEAASLTATRWMAGLRTKDDLRRFGRIAGHAKEALAAAKKAMDSLATAEDTAAKRRRTRWRDALATLGIFAESYEALSRAVPEGDADLATAQAACRDAALALVELRENEDADTAAAARLWQAALLEAGGRSAQSLTILDAALAPPKRLPYDFFNHLLRCTILVNGGSHALVAGLTLRMEQQCGRWFGSDVNAPGRAKFTLRAVRAYCLWRWSDALRPEQPDVAAAQARRADDLVAHSFPPGNAPKVYLFRPAVPVFAEIPPLEKPKSESGAETRPHSASMSRATSHAATAPATSQP